MQEELIAQPQAEIETFAETIAEPSTETVETTTPEFLKVKYNKEEIPLSQEQTIEYAQKGMNYDKVYKEYEELKNNPALNTYDKIKNFAEFSGMSVDEWINYLDEQRQQIEIEKYTKTGVSEEYAKELMQLKNQVGKQDEVLRKYQEQEKLNNEIQEFRTAYPNVNITDIPDEAFELKQNANIPLGLAYKLTLYSNIEKENTELKQKLNINKEHEFNSALTTGSS